MHKVSRLSLVLVLGLSGCSGESANQMPEFDARAHELAQKYIIVDTHIDVPYRLQEYWEDISQRTAYGDFDFVRARDGGLNVAFMSIYVPAEYQNTGGAKAYADSLIDMVEKFVRDWPDKFALATSVDDVRAQFGSGRVSLAMGMENGAPVEDRLENLQHFYDRGIRYITLAHSKANQICDSSYDPERKWNGLSPFGRQVVAEMNRLGIMIDISHVTDHTFYQVLRLTKAPVIASHSALRHFTPGWERNMSDGMLKALANNGGVVMIAFGSAFLKSEFADSSDSVQAKMRAYFETHGIEEGTPEAVIYLQKLRKGNPIGTIDDIVAHIDRAVQIAGIDHVGFGSDFDGVFALPLGMQDVSAYPNLIHALREKGYSEADIEKLCGANLLRVWAEVERVARELTEAVGITNGE